MPDAQDQRVHLCFDFGVKRFGVAVGSAWSKTGSELKPLRAKEGIPDWSAIDALQQKWQPSAFVVGLPLNMDGTESDMTARARKFSRRLFERFKLPVHLMDERLSSFEAKGMMRSRDGIDDFGKHSPDGLAACLILESWFAQQ